MRKLMSNVGVRVSIITVVINFFLFVFKLVCGLISHSNAMVSDAVHSLSDVITTIAVIFGLVLAGQEADSKHPYGHEKIESAFAVVLSFFLLVTGIGIGYVGVENIIKGLENNLVIPGGLALLAAIVSIVVKEIMFHYTMQTAKKISSSSMEADAWHHRSDALSSIGAFIGIFASRLGFPILDPICSLLICILIIKTAIEIFINAVKELVDTACDDSVNDEIIKTIMEIQKNIDINEFKSRMFGSRIYIDMEIALDGKITLNNANKIVNKIHDKIEQKYDLIKHCNIRVVPKK